VGGDRSAAPDARDRHQRPPSYDNALGETVIGLFKTGLIKPGGPWRTVEQVETATLE
jgi:hypothetical protein